MGASRLVLLVAIALLGAALCALKPTVAGMPGSLVALGGAALCAYALLVALAWFPMPWLSRQIEARFEGLVDASGATWYMAVALGSFATAETYDLVEQWAAIESVESSLRKTFAEWLVGFSLASFMNLLWAALWPIKAVPEYGPKLTAVFAAVVYAVVWLGQRVFGETRLARSARKVPAPGKSSESG